MISILFEYGNKDILESVMKGTEENPVPFTPHEPIAVNEMLENSYHVFLEPEMVTPLEDALKQPPLKMTFIGSYNNDGSQYIWTRPTEKQRNHSINKYKNKLNDVIEYDENGNEISRRRPTEAEALNTQTNKIYGQADRQLVDL